MKLAEPKIYISWFERDKKENTIKLIEYGAYLTVSQEGIGHYTIGKNDELEIMLKVQYRDYNGNYCFKNIIVPFKHSFSIIPSESNCYKIERRI